MTVRDIASALETWAHPALAEPYDNVGLLVGSHDAEVRGVLLTLDVTDAVLDEALTHGANLIVAHHPVWFGPRKTLTDNDWVGRLLLRAIRHEVHVYAIHTNLDNLADGVNAEMARRLGLENTRMLVLKPDTVEHLSVLVPPDALPQVEAALFAAGAGSLGTRYDQAAVHTASTSWFRPLPGAAPAVGQVGQRHASNETNLQVLYPACLRQQVLAALHDTHPYEAPAYRIDRHGAAAERFGAGLVGELPEALPKAAFLARVRQAFGCQAVRYADAPLQEVRRVALCGGAGSFLLPDAIRAGADAFVTADVTYHKFFDAAQRLLYLDIGHYESEQFTPHAIAARLTQIFPNFAFLISRVVTNPVSYSV